MSYKNFLDELSKGLPRNAYLFAAGDSFLLSEAAASVRSLVPEEERDFSFHSYDMISPGAESTPFSDILDVVNTVPFFGGKKVVLVWNSQKLLQKDIELLEKHLRSHPESSLLVLLNLGDIKKNTGEKLKAMHQIVLDIRAKDIPLWLRSKAREKGFDLTPDAAEYLIGSIGPDLGMLSSELEKCVLIGKDSITPDDIHSIVQGKRTYSAFDLVNALRAGDSKLAFRVCRVLMQTDEPYGIIGALNWHYSRLMTQKSSPDAKALFGEIFSLLKEADIQLKSTGGAYPIELLLIRLLRLSKAH